MCAIFMDQSKVQRKAEVKGSPSLSDQVPPPRPWKEYCGETLLNSCSLLGNCVSFHWDAQPFGMLLTHELPACDDLYL